jgi:outer membrane receptor for ferrienterochelin and colicin
MVANHLANLMISYQISKDWHTGTHVRYVGEKSREQGDSREKIAAYTTFDQTLTYTFKDFLIQASVKNIFDEDIVYSEAMGNNLSSGTYTNDLQRDGRVFWLSAEWKFK